ACATVRRRIIGVMIRGVRTEIPGKEEKLMRRMAMLLVSILIWSSTVLAGPTQFPVPLCCQFGTTYNPAFGNSPPTCRAISAAQLLQDCTKAGGTPTSGPCSQDGACGGSLVCCAGVSVGEACTAGANPVAVVDGCAVATEAA